MPRRATVPRPTPARRAAFADVLRRLRRMYGPIVWARRGPGLDVLVGAMLSQNTNMTNSRRGYRQLRRAFPTWPKVLAAPVEQVQRHIAICGLAHQRARRLQVLLARIKSDHPGRRGKLDLDWADRPAADRRRGRTCDRSTASAPRRRRTRCCSASTCPCCRWTTASCASPAD